MAVINDPNVAANVARAGPVDTSGGDFSVHVSTRPDDYGTLGHYSAHGLTGSIAAGAAALSEIAQLRYTGANKVIVYAVVLEHFRATTAFVAGTFLFDLNRSTSWTVDGSGGGTQTPEKLRTSMAAPTATFRIATTAALGAGTKTLSTQPLRGIRGNVSTGVAVAGGETELGSMTSAAISVGYPGPVPL